MVNPDVKYGRLSKFGSLIRTYPAIGTGRKPNAMIELRFFKLLFEFFVRFRQIPPLPLTYSRLCLFQIGIRFSFFTL